MQELVTDAFWGDLEGIDNDEFVKSEMALKDGREPPPNRPIAYDANGSRYMVIYFPLLFFLHICNFLYFLLIHPSYCI